MGLFLHLTGQLMRVCVPLTRLRGCRRCAGWVLSLSPALRR